MPRENPTPPYRAISRRRRVLYAAAMLVFALAVASVVVSGLERGHLVSTHRLDDWAVHLSPDWLKKESVPEGERWSFNEHHMVDQSFLVPKPAGTFRVVIAGGSFAEGSMYNWNPSPNRPPGGIPSWLEAELTMRYPRRRIEVINAGAAGVAVVGVRRIVAAMVDAEPDVLLVASGNNEGFVPPTSLNPLLHDWALYRLLKKVLLPRPLEKRTFFTPQDPDNAAIYRQYKENLKAIADAARRRHVPLILATLPINLLNEALIEPARRAMLPEFVPDEAYREGERLRDEQKYAEAIAAFERSANRVKALGQIGQCLYRLGRTEEAENVLRTYVENEPNSRMRPSLNQFVRSLARWRFAPLADFERTAIAAGWDGFPPPDFFSDACHLYWWGYYLMAQEALRAMFDADLLPPDPGPKPSLEDIRARYPWSHLEPLPDWWPPYKMKELLAP